MADNVSVILDWNVPNWITIGLMASVWFAVIGLGLKIAQKKSAKLANAAS